MSDVRQLPLFPNQPSSVQDLNRYTEFRHTLALFQDYLLKEGKSEHTVKAFTSDLQLLAEQAGDSIRIGDYTTAKLNAFLDWLEFERGVPCSRKSYARRVTTIKVYFKWLHSMGAIAYDPARPVLQRSGPAPLATILSPEQVHEALSFARHMGRGEKPDARPEMLFRLLLDTGIKKGETMSLTEAHINRDDPENPTLIVKHKMKNIYKERTIALNPTWLDVLDIYMAQYDLGDTLFNCTARNLEYVLQDISDGAGLPVKISFEMLRWTCGVRDYRAGDDPEKIRDKLGLSDTSWIETFGKIKKLADQQVRDEEQR
jgi:integrase/recombinase XerD